MSTRIHYILIIAENFSLRILISHPKLNSASYLLWVLVDNENFSVFSSVTDLKFFYNYDVQNCLNYNLYKRFERENSNMLFRQDLLKFYFSRVCRMHKNFQFSIILIKKKSFFAKFFCFVWFTKSYRSFHTIYEIFTQLSSTEFYLCIFQ